MPEIVVGMDGSSGAAQALVWADREAAQRGWDLAALLAWGLLVQHHADLETPFDPEYAVGDRDDIGAPHRPDSMAHLGRGKGAMELPADIAETHS